MAQVASGVLCFSTTRLAPWAITDASLTEGAPTASRACCDGLGASKRFSSSLV